ncbi:peptidase M14 [Striga asiatica]|uniref:Peptidase M14 n=1 Tax=Striga asiatica TaxID=4170 RepID=A0A5A7PJQ9_STRAF|nr:peptidase M14 [Striga asiatica]
MDHNVGSLIDIEHLSSYWPNIMMDPNDPSLKYWFIQSKKHAGEICSDWVRYLLEARCFSKGFILKLCPFLILRLSSPLSVKGYGLVSFDGWNISHPDWQTTLYHKSLAETRVILPTRLQRQKAIGYIF